MRKLIHLFATILTFIILLLACKKEDLPMITTVEITNLTTSSAESGLVVLSDGGGKISEKGICWDSSPNPTIQSQKTMDGGGSGTYSSKISGLTTNNHKSCCQ